MAKNKKTIGIIGLGKFGMCLANELVKNGRSIVCIDKDETKIKRALEICDYAFVSQDLSINTLEETGFKECDTIVVCIGEQMDVAILATISALNLGVRRVIALSNTDEQGMILEKFGAEVIYPYKDSAYHLAKKMSSSSLVEFTSLSEDIEIYEVKAPKRYINVMIKDTDIRQKYKINIIAISNNGKINTNIDPNYVLTSEDVIIVLGEKKNLDKFEASK